MEKPGLDTAVAAWLKSRRAALIYFLLFGGSVVLVYYLFRLPWQASGYTLLLGLFGGLLVAVPDFLRFYGRVQELHKHVGRFPTGVLPPARTLPEEQYHAMVRALEQERLRLAAQITANQKNDDEYYTLWVHQIKTPLAAMQLLLQQGEGTISPAGRATLQQEVFRTGQYVGMVLQYQRLTSPESDLLFREHRLPALVKKAVKNCAPLFIYKNIPLTLEVADTVLVTDEKWFVFVLEQLLTNAVKYTAKGNITVTSTAHTLTVQDTGVGILPEDLPRVFQRGYTGSTGRQNSHSTGIGLYLCREILQKLGFSIRLESKPGKGTTAIINIAQTRAMPD